jgi:hypothetical protein
MAMNVGELFKFLNSEFCDGFYQGLTYDNKKEISDKMMNNESFISLAHEFVSDDNMIRSKIDTKLGQLLKKNTKPVTPHELFLANQDGISRQLEKSKLGQLLKKNTKPVTPHELFLANQDGISNQLEKLSTPAIIDTYGKLVPPELVMPYDEEKGKHIGSGIYLKHEGHLIKMTTNDFTVYY